MSYPGMSQNYVELVLYHGLDVTGSIEVSLTSSSGPWTKLTLTSAQGVQDALAEWATLAETAFSPETFTFEWTDGPALSLVCSAAFWLRVSATLAELLGLSSTIKASTPSGGSHIITGTDLLGVIYPTAIARTQPRTIEVAELEKFRMGRAISHHHSRRREVDVELYVEEVLAEEWLRSPIISGHAAFYVVMQDVAVDPDTGDPYGEDNLGGRLLLYPIDTATIETIEGSGNEVVVAIRATLEGP